MEYPVWWIPGLSGALPIAVIAIVHVFVAHFAVGGGLFLVLVERAGLRRNDPEILAYGKRHTKFFLLVSMVFGGLTGVAIWFVIALVSPQVTGLLVQEFVFGWATEWIFFLGEIVALLVYYYTYGMMRAREHQFVGWCYVVFGFLSLFVINGIVGFMLTPGEWLQSRDFWDGLFNPTFWPSLTFRSGLALTLAGLFGFVTAPRIASVEARERMVRFSALFTACPFVLMLAGAVWYVLALPVEQQEMVLKKSTEIPLMMSVFLVVSPLVLLGGLAMSYLTPQRNRFSLAMFLLLLGLMQIGSFEWMREAARRPYLVHGRIYSSGVHVDAVNALVAEGALPQAKWAKHKAVTAENKLEAGRDLFAMQCLPCHSIGGYMLDILPRTVSFTLKGMESQLAGQGRVLDYMPPFAGDDTERNALATYIIEELHGRSPEVKAEYTPQQKTPEIPPFDPDEAEYALAAWSDKGMHVFSDSARIMTVTPPGVNVYAQLIRRGDSPELVTEDVTLTYKVETGFEKPEKHLRFWEFLIPTFHLAREPGQGMTENYVAGEMTLNDEMRVYSASMAPTAPYPDQGGYDPYPLFTVEARDSASGQLLASTRVVGPASTEMGCKNCHAGGWKAPEGNPVTGVSDETAMAILKSHDRISKTSLYKEAMRGHPLPCQKCHAVVGGRYEGDEKLLSLSASIHGFHANYLPKQSAEACGLCHPSNPQGATRGFRGVHAAKGLNCTQCHGTLEDMAVGLLKHEAEGGKKGAVTLLSALTGGMGAAVEEIAPRSARTMAPDCGACHDFETKPAGDASAFNAWADASEDALFTQRRDEMDAVMCQACHGAPHALYPARNAYGETLDVIQPLQYQGVAGVLGTDGKCLVCHTEEMDESLHHSIPESEE